MEKITYFIQFEGASSETIKHINGTSPMKTDT